MFVYPLQIGFHRERSGKHESGVFVWHPQCQGATHKREEAFECSVRESLRNKNNNNNIELHICNNYATIGNITRERRPDLLG